MAYPVTPGKVVIDMDFDNYDYDKEYIGDEMNIPRYRVIRTFSKDYNSKPVRYVRETAQFWFKECHNVDNLRNEKDIYNYLSNSDNLLIGILENQVYYIYCLSRKLMSKRAMNNKNFRYNYMGKDYVKFLPKIWTSEEGFQALLNSDYSIYLFNIESSFDSMIGIIDIEDEGESFPLAQKDNYGKFAKFDKAWDLLYFEKILQL